MKVASFRDAGHERFGVVVDGRLVAPPLGALPWATLDDVIADGQLEALGNLPRGSDTFALADVEFMQPLTRTRFFCMGMNYPKILPDGSQAHAERLDHPAFFLKDPSALVAHRQPLLVPRVSAQLDYEGELAAVVGIEGHQIRPADAARHVAGFTVLNDGSVRDWQAHSLSAGKNFYRSGSWGPFLTMSADVPETDRLRLTTRVNGKIVQDGRVGDMFFSIAEVIAYLSHVTPLRRGDVIAFGSPTGSASSDPSLGYLGSGDIVRIEIESLGVLENAVAAMKDETCA